MTGSDQKPRKHSAGEDALLVVYGAYVTQDGKRVTGETIFEALVGNGYWLASRLPIDHRNGMRVLFYQAGVGFTATAELVQTELARPSDWTLAGANPIMLFPKKLVLEDVRVFSNAIPAKPLIQQLTFIRNKAHWGNAFMRAPKIVPDSDVAVVVQSAKVRA